MPVKRHFRFLAIATWAALVVTLRVALTAAPPPPDEPDDA